MTAPGRFGIGEYRDRNNEGGPLGLANPVIGLIGDLGGSAVPEPRSSESVVWLVAEAAGDSPQPLAG